MKTGYELLPHTADLLLRVTAADKEQLLFEAARGLYAAAGRPQPVPGSPLRRTLSFSAAAPELLLRDFLAELLYLLDREALVLTALTILRFDAGALELAASFCALPLSSPPGDREIKAVTYHALRLDKTPQGFLAEFLLDI